ncbi:MAG: hypothetical protein PHV62_07900, partial [Sulfuricurvum sp.]|nr:hypothetical protein [Sulfuricurvum sp.]
MSKNVAQVYVANPVTTIGNTDLFYTAASGTTDAAFTGATLKAAVSPLTTKGDLYTYSTVNTRLAVAVGDGKILQVSSGAATGLAWSTPTYPSASGTAGKLIASDGTNNVYTTATFPVVGGTAGNIFISNGTNYVASTSLWPNTVGTALHLLLSDGTSNVYSTPAYPNASVTAGKVIISDGTNYIASTSIFPNTVGAVGKIIRSDGTVNAYTTATFADTYAASTLLYSNGANTVTGLATANSAALVTTSAGVPIWTGSMTDGQVVVGSTGATPVAATVGSSGNISITVGAGTLSIGTSGFASFAYNSVAGTTQSAAVNNGYVISNASQTTVTLPATAALGSVIAVQGNGAGGWILTANTGQTIKLGSSTTSSAGT